MPKVSNSFLETSCSRKSTNFLSEKVESYLLQLIGNIVLQSQRAFNENISVKKGDFRILQIIITEYE